MHTLPQETHSTFRCLSDCQCPSVLHTETQTAATTMLNGSTAVFVMSANHGHHLLAGGSGGGDDDPTRYPFTFKSVHELDAVDVDVPAAKKPAVGGHFECPICDRVFGTEKGVHGHMRCHYDRPWRGMEPPKPPPLVLAADGNLYRYVCPRCREPFNTRQALGGHRASHSGKKGCFWLAKEELAAAAAQAPFVHDFDLNVPVPEAEQQQQQQQENDN